MGIRILLALLTIGLPASSIVHAQERRPVAIHAEILWPPAIAYADRATYMVYELHLTNFYAGPFELHAVEVLDATDTTAFLARFAGFRLTANLKHFPSSADTSRPDILEAGRRVALMAWVPVDSMRLPDAIRHRVLVALPGREEVYEMLTPPVGVGHAPPVLIGAPVRRGPWLAANAPWPESVPGHNRLVFPRDNRMAFPQRFATDWVKFGADGRLWTGDMNHNEAWHSYGEEVVAVEDGVVTSVLDGVLENTPPEITTQMTQATVAGNVVVLNIGSGRYAVYAHLQPGSIRVSAGDRVHKGDPLARVGNSGNSTAPHLHFHVLDAPAAAAGEGVPFVYDAFEWLGPSGRTLEELEAGAEWMPSTVEAEPRQRDLPTKDSVVRF